MPTRSNFEPLRLTGTIVAAYVRSNQLPVSDLAATIKGVYGTLAALTGQTSFEIANTKEPAVPVSRSLTPGYIVCLEDGKKLKMLKRYLRTRYGLTDQYRARWNLPQSYPMVASNYSAVRSTLAKKAGLGRIGKSPRSK